MNTSFLRGGDSNMPDKEAAYSHHLRLVELFLTRGMDENARWWLDRELSELEQDMKASGLL
jgi:hypothetical protein